MSVASCAILSNFFEEQWTQNYPQYFLRLSRALFPKTFLEIAVYAWQFFGFFIGVLIKISIDSIELKRNLLLETLYFLLLFVKTVRKQDGCKLVANVWIYEIILMTGYTCLTAAQPRSKVEESPGGGGGGELNKETP